MTNLSRIAAPISMAAAGFVAAVGGVLVYVAVGAFVISFPVEIPEAMAMPLYTLFIALPLFIAFYVLGRVSRTLYRQDSVALPAALLHLWHCALLYPVAAVTLYLALTCPGTAAPVPGHCADQLGMSMAAGVVALGGIIADGWCVARRHQCRSGPACR